MIRIWFYNTDEFARLRSEYKIFTYCEGEYERLTNWQYDKECNPIKPFRDEYSIELLKETYDVEFISDDDWYSIKSPKEERFCLSGLSTTMKYALYLIHNSKKGKCTELVNCEKRIWKVLDSMPIDILVAVDITNINEDLDLELGVDYVIENYSLNDKEIKLNVTENRGYLIDSNYKKVGDTPIYLKDEKYYIDSISFKFHEIFYFWKEHIEDIIKWANNYTEKEYPIINKTITCSLLEFIDKINLDYNVDYNVDSFLYWNEYARQLLCYNNMLNDNEISKEEYDKALKILQKENEKEYKQYLWYINDFKIISHLYVLPKERISRKLPVLIVDKYFDGSYKIWGGLTVKYPRFNEILECLIYDYYTEKCERYVIIVDVEELFTSACDIKYTNCGFKITKKCLEIFDPNDAIKLFADIAHEALSSEKCEISKEFY